MKKRISILLLFLMVSVMANSAMVFHFCGNTKVAATLLKNDDRSACCETTEHENSSQNHHDECCHLVKVELTTDKFQIENNVYKVTPPNLGVYDYPNHYAFNIMDRSFTIISKHLFPPNNQGLQNVDLRTLICIYRI